MKAIPWEVNERKFSDAYVAGFFDGDGSLVATLGKNTLKYRRAYRPRIKINFTQHVRQVEMLRDLQKYLGAGIVRVASAHDQAELVIVDRNDVSRVLGRMLPHLVLKEQQAILALEIITQLGENLRTNRISEDNYQAIMKSITKIRILNSNTGGKRNLESFDPVTTQSRRLELLQRNKKLKQ